MSSIRIIQEQNQENQEAQNAKDEQKNEKVTQPLSKLEDKLVQNSQNQNIQYQDSDKYSEAINQNGQQKELKCIETDQQQELKSPINEKVNNYQNQIEVEEFKNSDKIESNCHLQDQNQSSIKKVKIEQQNEHTIIETDKQRLPIQNDEENYQKINFQNQQNSIKQQVCLNQLQNEDILRHDPQFSVSVQLEQAQNLENTNLPQNEIFTNQLSDVQTNQEKSTKNDQGFCIQLQGQNNFNDEQEIMNNQLNEIEDQKLEQEKISNQIEQIEHNNLDNNQKVQKENEQILFQLDDDDNKSYQNPDQAYNNEDNYYCNFRIKENHDNLNFVEQQEQSDEQKNEINEQLLDNLQILQEIQDCSQQQKDPNYHLLQESKSVEDLKCLLEDQKNAQVKKGKKKKQLNASKKIFQRSELSNFLKKHDLVSSNNLSEKEGQNKKTQNKIQQKSIVQQSNTAVKIQKPNLFPIKKEEKKLIYRFCRDPYNQRFNQNVLPKRKFFSILSLNLFKYNIELICSFLNDKEILKLRLVSRTFQPYLSRYFESEKLQKTQNIICLKKAEILKIKDKINKTQYYNQKIQKLTEQINENISHLYVYLYFDKLDIVSLNHNEVKLLKLFYEALITKPSIINSLQVLNYCANKEEVTTLFGNLTLSYDYMDKKLQHKFYSELQVIVDFIKINNSAIIPSILENQIFTFSPEMIKKIESNIYIDKTYSSKILKGIYYWFELQLFYNQFFEKEAAFLELYKNQEQINYLRHTYEINNYLLRKIY
ncbi:hypothetical protein ABPG74_008513 [Tetrahymena malaccensis]